ncbi:MAG: PLP-dependent aminotransferase family protein [Vicinamibacterales bacterium]
MPTSFASRMREVKASDIRELLKITERPDVISMAGGLPAPELFPIEELRALADEVLRDEGHRVLQYAPTEGNAALRERIASLLRARQGIESTADAVLVTNGSQQGLDLTGKVFLDPGDVVLCESPTYVGAISALRVFQPRFVEVETDDEGMLPEALDRALTTEARVKIIYVVPDFQNPSGRCWSLERRHRLLELASRHGIVVIEDAPYAELRYSGEPVPAIKSMDADGRVVYLGTFSKTFCPGLRIGWLTARRDLYDKYVLVKQGADLHSSGFSQRLISRFYDRYDFGERVERLRAAYRPRRDAMSAAIESEMPEGVRATQPEGGLFLWAELPADVSARDVLPRAIERNVAFVPGGSFFPNGGRENTMRLNFSNQTEARIAEGVRRLAAALREVMAAKGVGTLSQGRK